MTVSKPQNVNAPDWSYPPHILSLQPSIIREILKISSKPGIISFAGGLPAPELFPLEEITESVKRVINEHKGDVVQYSLSRGITPLRGQIAERISSYETATDINQLLVTSGAQQAVDMLARVFLQPGDKVLTEYPTYVGALQIFKYHQVEVVSAGMDDDGLITDRVEEQIQRHKPKLIYTVSTFQNPTGITMTEKRRVGLIELCRKCGVPLVDDNPYGDLRFTGKHVPTMKALGGDSVISISTVSKILAPGLRLGWINARKDLIDTLEKIKQSIDLHAGTLNEYIFYDFLKRGQLDPHIEKIKADYGAKRQVMLEQMQKCFPQSVSSTRPEGGLFLWVTLPEGISANDLFKKAIERKVAFVIGQPFYPDGGVTNTFRLNFATASKEKIVEGITGLGELLQEVV